MDVDLKQTLDGFDPAEHEEETQQRWGDTEQFRVSAQRTRRYKEADWRALKEEQAAIYRDAAAAQQQGLAPDSPVATAVAERHRLNIDRWFYPCSHPQHAALADLYEGDARFAANIDRYGPGLTAFFSAAIRANALRARP